MTIVFASKHTYAMLLIHLLFYQLRELGEKGHIPLDQTEYTAALIVHTEKFLELE